MGRESMIDQLNLTSAVSMDNKINELSLLLQSLRSNECDKSELNFKLREQLAEACSKLISLKGCIVIVKKEIEKSIHEEIISASSASKDDYEEMKREYLIKKCIRGGDEDGEQEDEFGFERNKLREIQISKELYEKREELRLHVNSLEKTLSLTRSHLNRSANELVHKKKKTITSNSNHSSLGANEEEAGGEEAVADEEREISRSLRKTVINLSNLLETTESEFLTAQETYKKVESDLSAILKVISVKNRVPSNPTLFLNELTRDNGNIESNTKLDAIFTVDEIIDGKADLQRINGETAKEFRIKLQNRLSMLNSLEENLLRQIENLRFDLKEGTEALKQNEARKMQVELELVKLEQLATQWQLEVTKISLAEALKISPYEGSEQEISMNNSKGNLKNSPSSSNVKIQEKFSNGHSLSRALSRTRSYVDAELNRGSRSPTLVLETDRIEEIEEKKAEKGTRIETCSPSVSPSNFLFTSSKPNPYLISDRLSSFPSSSSPSSFPPPPPSSSSSSSSLPSPYLSPSFPVMSSPPILAPLSISMDQSENGMQKDRANEKVQPGRKNVMFTDEGEMIILDPGRSKKSIESKSSGASLLIGELSSPIHSPYDRNGRKVMSSNKNISSIPRLASTHTKKSKEGDREREKDNEIVTTAATARGNDEELFSHPSSSSLRTPPVRSYPSKTMKTKEREKATPATMEKVIDRLDKMASVLELQFKHFQHKSDLHLSPADDFRTVTKISSSPAAVANASPSVSLSPSRLLLDRTTLVQFYNELQILKDIAHSNNQMAPLSPALNSPLPVTRAATSPSPSDNWDVNKGKQKNRTEEAEKQIEKDEHHYQRHRSPLVRSQLKKYLQNRRESPKRRKEIVNKEIPWHKRREDKRLDPNLVCPSSPSSPERSRGRDIESERSVSATRLPSYSPTRGRERNKESPKRSMDSSNLLTSSIVIFPRSFSSSPSLSQTTIGAGGEQLKVSTTLRERINLKQKQSHAELENVLRQRLLDTRQQLYEAEQDEKVSKLNSTIDMDKKGESRCCLSLTVVSAKNLPVMKQLTKNCDPYVEISLSLPEVAMSLMNTSRKKQISLNVSSEHDDKTLDVEKIKQQRTSTKWGELFPKFDENFMFKKLPAITGDVFLTVRDAQKRPISQEDPIIGTTSFSLSLLSDQKKHTMILSLAMPEKRVKSLPAMIDGQLKIEAKLFYSKILLLRQKMYSLETRLSECSQLCS